MLFSNLIPYKAKYQKYDQWANFLQGLSKNVNLFDIRIQIFISDFYLKQ